MATWPLDPRRAGEWTLSMVEAVVGTASTTASNVGIPMPPRLPFDPLGMLLDLLKSQVIGRRITHKFMDKEVKLTLDSLEFDGNELLRALGQYGTVRVTAHDIEVGHGRSDHLYVEAHNVHLRPGPIPAVVASPIHFRTRMSEQLLREWIQRHYPAIEIMLDHERLIVGLSGRLAWAKVEVEPVAAGPSIRMNPKGFRIGSNRLGLGLPGYNIELPAMPFGATVTNVETTTTGITIEGLVPEWRRSLGRSDIELLVSAIKSGVSTIVF